MRGWREFSELAAFGGRNFRGVVTFGEACNDENEIEIEKEDIPGESECSNETNTLKSFKDVLDSVQNISAFLTHTGESPWRQSKGTCNSKEKYKEPIGTIF